MALNAKHAPKGGKEFPPMEAGSYPARVVQVIDLGVQPQEYKGETKTPRQMISMSYEFVDEFLPDENDEPDETKPRWLSEQFPINHLSSTLAKSTERYYALDPNEEYDGDFTQLINIPCNVTVVQNKGTDGKIRNKIAGVSAMRQKDAARTPELVNPPKVFVMDEPDLEIFLSLPNWLQDKIKDSLEYAGSPLEAALAANKGQPSQDKPKAAGKPPKALKANVHEEDETDEDENW